MELKVWVNGIQKVVSGASYTTTCQDVVLALASAMGQTGRFTLIEKWRDIERPLIPAECPLLSLNKWGEYAGGVRYYLVQVQVDNARQQENISYRMLTPALNINKYMHNLAPPQAPQQKGHPPGSKLIKRSSTFSGAHTTGYRNLSSASSLVRTEEHINNLNGVFSAKVKHTRFDSAPDETTTSLLPPISSDSSTWLPTVMNRDTHGQCAARQHLSQSLNQHVQDDKREVHLENMPGTLSIYPRQSKEYSSDFQFPSQQSKLMYSEHSVFSPWTEHKKPQEEVQHCFVISPELNISLSSSQKHKSSAKTIVSRSYHTQQQQQHISSSQLPIPHSYQYIQGYSPIPAPRHQRGPSGNGGNTSGNTSNHQKHSDQSQKVSNNNSPIFQDDIVNFPGGFNNDIKENTEREFITSTTSCSPAHKNIYDSINTSNDSNEIIKQFKIPRNGSPEGLFTISDKSINQRLNQDPCPSEFDRPAILDENTKPICEKMLFIKSLRTHDEDSQCDIFNGRSVHGALATSDLEPHQKNGEDSKLNNFNSTDNSITSRRVMSTFASAVAHIRQNSGDNLLKQPETHMSQHSNTLLKVLSETHMRQHSDTLLNVSSEPHVRQHSDTLLKVSSEPHVRQHSDTLLKASSETHVRQHSDTLLKVPSETHVRQHSSDNSKVNDYFKDGYTQTQVTYSVGDLHSDAFAHSLFRNERQSNSITSASSVPKHNSDSDDSSVMTCSKDTTFPPLLTNEKLNQSTSNVLNEQNSNVCQNQGRMIGQVSFEIEEYDLDQNFPDEPQRETFSNISGSMSNQIEGEYIQLLRIVHSQQGKMKLQEAQIKDVEHEITALSSKEFQDETKLQEIVAEVFKLEKQETDAYKELKSLDQMEWMNLLAKEQELEQNLKIQMKKLTMRMEHVEFQIYQLRAEEHKKSEELISEIEKTEVERMRIEEEDTSRCLQELKTETREPACVSNCSHIPVAAAPGVDFSESGEAILKILEGQLSAYSPPSFPREDSGIILYGVTPSQYMHSSAVAAKTYSGVWV